MPLNGQLVVALAKITDYLLEPTHPDGGPKCRFFASFGFAATDPAELMDALQAHARMRPTFRVQNTPFGQKTVLRCSLPTPDGRDPCILSIWLRERGSNVHRLLTAYPAK